MSEVVFRWVIGIGLVSMVLGGVASFLWYELLAGIYGVEREKAKGLRDFLKERGVITGIVERVFFAVAIGKGLASITIAMVAWTTLKPKTLWAFFSGEYKTMNADDENKPNLDRVSVGLLASLGSMIIAIIAGKICAGDMEILKVPIETLRVYLFG